MSLSAKTKELIMECNKLRMKNEDVSFENLPKNAKQMYAILKQGKEPTLDEFLDILDTLGYTLEIVPQKKDADVTYLERAARESRTDAALWKRYLRKVINGSEIKLSKRQIKMLLRSKSLSKYQKMLLEQGTKVGSAVNEEITSLNKKSTTPNYKKVKERFDEERRKIQQDV